MTVPRYLAHANAAQHEEAWHRDVSTASVPLRMASVDPL
jgi:hypothetical protein